ncbi:TIGR04283 family arsenosugar biosynthesis glycosyltransferase [Thiosocius teredinicola]|uniref:TIGR04283 family arsenosugar biosynthesis glycosyltransferase n=1 Tax=Thiosocius teredinicola TaxID=1973002 RepID=UPI00099114C7
MQPHAPALSIIIPTLNEARAIGLLLSDLAAQTCDQALLEIIVVDGGSDDATRSIAGTFNSVVTTAARGRAAQMNAGAALARADTLWFVHADSRLAPTAAATLLERTSPPVWGFVDVRLSGAARLLRVVEFLMNLRSAASGIATGDQGIFVQRSIFEQLGGFPSIPLMEDIALSKSLKALARPVRLRQPRIVTSSRRWESAGIVRTILLMWRLRMAYALGVPPSTLAKLYR